MTVTMQDAPPALAGMRISKRFPGVVALDNVDYSVRHGEIHALLGENGAGKSTLIKIFSGDQQADGGSLVLNGEDIQLSDPRAARERGITVVPQDVLVVPELTIGRNIILGLEGAVVRKDGLDSSERYRVDAALERVGALFPADALARDLSVPELRLAQLARCVVRPGEVIVLDEPTAVLSESDAEHLLARLQDFRGDGKAIVYVTHRLSEVLAHADRATVLRDGRCVGVFERSEFDKDRIVNLMADREGSDAIEAPVTSVRVRGNAPVVLTASGIANGVELRDVSIEARAGQIVGVAGVQGSGHGHLLHALAGASRVERGEMSVDGKEIAMSSLQQAFDAGVVLVPADRKGAGIVGQQTVCSNSVLTRRVRLTLRRWGFRWRRAEKKVATGYVQTLDIHASGIEALVATLSGGNQQKVVLARAFEGRPRVLLLEEPTQGIDVNAKREIRRLLVELVEREACAVILATSEFEELLGMADPIHVMCSGRLVATLKGESATYRGILHHALP